MALCGCVPGAELADVANRATEQDFGEIQKIIVQRRLNGSARNEFTIVSANPNLKASWTPLLAASNSTKVVTTPFTHGLKNEVGEAISFGGNGETVGGVPRNIGKNPSKFEANFYGAWQSTMAALEGYACEDLHIFFVNECGQIAGLSDNVTTPTKFFGFPVARSTWFISDKGFGGKTASDMNKLMFSFLPNTTKYFTVITPTDFDPLTDADFNPVV
jgi:hypothetical protein